MAERRQRQLAINGELLEQITHKNSAKERQRLADLENDYLERDEVRHVLTSQRKINQLALSAQQNSVRSHFKWAQDVASRHRDIPSTSIPRNS